MKTTEVRGTFFRHGFTLVEVIVATTVMAFMMVALLQFVSFAGEVWQRTHQAVTLSTEGNALLDTIERELAAAKVITSPMPGAAAANSVRFIKTVSDYQGTPVKGDAGLEILWDAPNKIVKTQIIALPTTWTSATTGGAKVMDTDMYNYPLTRNVIDFQVIRTSTNLIDFYVKIEIERNAKEDTRTTEVRRSVLLTSF